MTCKDVTLPEFPFRVPQGYAWLVARRLFGFEPNSAFQPWFFLGASEAFSVKTRWPQPTKFSEIFAFARRQDCDDLACFATFQEDREPLVLVIHGWTPDGYEVVGAFDSIWDWLRSAVDDVREWVAVD